MRTCTDTLKLVFLAATLITAHQGITQTVVNGVTNRSTAQSPHSGTSEPSVEVPVISFRRAGYRTIVFARSNDLDQLFRQGWHITLFDGGVAVDGPHLLGQPRRSQFWRHTARQECVIVYNARKGELRYTVARRVENPTIVLSPPQPIPIVTRWRSPHRRTTHLTAEKDGLETYFQLGWGVALYNDGQVVDGPYLLEQLARSRKRYYYRDAGRCRISYNTTSDILRYRLELPMTAPVVMLLPPDVCSASDPAKRVSRAPSHAENL